jgi:steroid delta-isomerase-like uncharacterized protein
MIDERSSSMTALLTEAQTADKMVKIAREQLDAFNSGDWERMRAGLASDSRYDELGTERKVDGPDKIIEVYKGWKQAFPDAAGTVTGAFASGDTAVLEVTWKGTHTGPLTTAQGTIPASGKSQKVPAAIFYTFDGDTIKESRHYFDTMTLLKQIGVQPK